jgi:hypothetical protein
MKLLLIILVILFLYLTYDCYCKQVIDTIPTQNKIEQVIETKQLDDPLHNKLVFDQLEEYVNRSDIPNYTENNISTGTAMLHPITVEDYN